MSNSQQEPSSVAIRILLIAAGMADEYRSTILTGGANNRTYRIDVGTKSVLLKWYFDHPDDPRDRLGTEFSFLQFAWKQGVTAAPQPLACDTDNRLGLYEFISGNLPVVAEITDARINAAVDFVRALNNNRHEPDAAALAAASEACFSIDAHLNCVQSRVAQLTKIEPLSEIDATAREFVDNRLQPKWESVAKAVQKQCKDKMLSPEDELPLNQRCLSPSDFGYHNALVTPEGDTRFIDLEYAGWDDPAKLICDFFCQVKVPVPGRFQDSFTNSIAGLFPQAEMLRTRVDSLLPVYKLKWCCIMLNEFLPTAAARRNFSESDDQAELRKMRQLEKAQNYLSRLNAD